MYLVHSAPGYLNASASAEESKCTEERILFALKQADGGQSVGDVCRQWGFSEETFYVRKKRYANVGLLEFPGTPEAAR